MKHAKHENRRSFRKWAAPVARLKPEMRAVDVKNRIRMKSVNRSVPATHKSSQFTLQKHTIVSDPAGPKARWIPADVYNPQLKAPSRRDCHRAEVARRNHGH